VLLAALLAQASVVVLFLASDLGFLWYNVIGCGIVVVAALALQVILPPPRDTSPRRADV
jgi:hypothetical protein